MTPLEAARSVMSALEPPEPERAGVVVADEVVIELPGGVTQLHGKDGARQLMRMAPPFVRTIREEDVAGDMVVLKGLTRAPGQFANYTTWTFETDGERITRVTFAWKPAN